MKASVRKTRCAVYTRVSTDEPVSRITQYAFVVRDLRRVSAYYERLGRDVTQSEILERLRNSGMTRSQIRARLQQLGYDPSLADRYFDAWLRHNPEAATSLGAAPELVDHAGAVIPSGDDAQLAVGE